MREPVMHLPGAAPNIDDLYKVLLHSILAEGSPRQDRTGVGTRALFGRTLELDLRQGFPLIALRRLSFRLVLLEELWKLKGCRDATWLYDQGVRMWAPWAASVGNIGPTVGRQWRAWPTPQGPTDQLLALLEGLRQRPHSRRHLLSAWNVADLPDETLAPVENAAAGKMALSPCLVTHQFHVQDGHLSMMVHQRSADAFVGLPHDIAGAALTLNLIARWLGLTPHRLVMCLGDVHLYETHLTSAQTLLKRAAAAPPQLIFHSPAKLPFDYEEADMALEGYVPHERVVVPVAV